MTIKDYSHKLTMRVCNLRKGDRFYYNQSQYLVLEVHPDKIIYEYIRPNDGQLNGKKYYFGSKNQMKVELIEY